jgi:hypothetical protein
MHASQGGSAQADLKNTTLRFDSLAWHMSCPEKVFVSEKRVIFVPNEIFPEGNPKSQGALALCASFARSIFEHHDSLRMKQQRTIHGVELIVMKDHIPRLLDVIKALAKAAGYSDDQIAQIKPEQYEQPTSQTKRLHDKPAFTAKEVASDPTSPWYRPRSN